MKKLLLTESQARLLLEEVDKNDSIQKLILSAPEDIKFDIQKDMSNNGVLPVELKINNKNITDKYIKLSLKQVKINGELFYHINIWVNDELRRMGIAYKVCYSFIKEGNPVCNIEKYSNNETNKLWDKLSQDTNLEVEDVKDKNGKKIGVKINEGKTQLDESEYIKMVIEKYSNNLNESSFGLSNLFKALFKGCRTFNDYKKRIKKILIVGGLSAFVLINLIKMIPCTNEEKNELANEVNVEQTVSGGDEKSIVKNTNFATSFNISNGGIKHIQQYEKLSLTPYFPTTAEKGYYMKTNKSGNNVGKTIGWGHVVKSNDPQWLKNTKSISREQADELFKKDIQEFVQQYNSSISKLPRKLRNPNLYTQGFIDAGISVIYNAGIGNFQSSDFFRTWQQCRINNDTGKIRLDDYNYTCSKIKKCCVTQNGVVLSGLKTRRNSESLMAQIR